MAKKTLIQRIAQALAVEARNSSEIAEIVAVLHHSASRKEVLAALVDKTGMSLEPVNEPQSKSRSESPDVIDAATSHLEDLLRNRAHLTTAQAFKWLESQTRSRNLNRKAGFRRVLRELLMKLPASERDNLVRAAFNLLANEQPGVDIVHWWEEYDRRLRK